MGAGRPPESQQGPKGFRSLMRSQVGNSHAVDDDIDLSVVVPGVFDDIVVVSLPESLQRREHSRRHLEKVGLPGFRFFEATAAADPAVEAYRNRGEVVEYPPCFRCGKLDCGDPDCNNFLIPEQIATFITYLRLWESIRDGDAGRVLVLEDDVRFHSCAPKVISRLAQWVASGRIPFESETPTLLRLGWAYCRDHRHTWRIRYSRKQRMANPCHAVTRAFARALLERYTGICHTADVYQHKIAPREGEAWTVFPPIASDLSWTMGSLPSTIHPKAVRTEFLRKEGEAAAAEANRRRVSLHVKKKYYRPILIVGHPRCGTGYAAELCGQLGLDVGHERAGADGISSWMFAVEANENPYALDEISRSRRKLVWTWLLMPVRDLGTAIASVMRESERAPPSLAFRREHILREIGIDLYAFEDPFEAAIWSISSWARMILPMEPDLVFRIEDEHEKLREFLLQKKLIDRKTRQRPLDTKPVNADKAYQGLRHPKPSIGRLDWTRLRDDSRGEIEWYCNAFGYPSPLSASGESAGKDAKCR